MPQAAPMIIMAVMAAASTAMQIQAANKQADAQEDAAKAAAASDYQQLDEQQTQVSQQAAIEKSERARVAMQERAALRVAQGESGLAGISLGKEMGAIDFNESYDMSLIEANRSNRVRQAQVEKEAVKANAQGRLNVAASQKVSGLSAGLQIGASAVQGGASGYTYGKSWSTK